MNQAFTTKDDFIEKLLQVQPSVYHFDIPFRRRGEDEAETVGTKLQKDVILVNTSKMKFRIGGQRGSDLASAKTGCLETAR